MNLGACRSVAPVTEHRSLHFVWLHVIAEYKFPLQWSQILCEISWRFSVRVPRSLRTDRSMRSLSGLQMNSQGNAWCYEWEQNTQIWPGWDPAFETACETQLYNSSRHQLSRMCWSHLWNLGNAGCRLMCFSLTKVFVPLLVFIWWLHFYVLRSEQRLFG